MLPKMPLLCTRGASTYANITPQITAPTIHTSPALRPFPGVAAFVWRPLVGDAELPGGVWSASRPTTVVAVTMTTPPLGLVDVYVIVFVVEWDAGVDDELPVVDIVDDMPSVWVSNLRLLR